MMVESKDKVLRYYRKWCCVVTECTIVNLTVTSWTLLFRWNTISKHAASSYCHMAVSVIADCMPGQARPHIAHIHPPSLINL